MASLYITRFPQSGQKEDLDLSILYSTEAVFVASHSKVVYQDTIRGFYLLASGLINRLRHFKHPCDAQPCIEYFRYLESQPLEPFGVSLDEVKVGLLAAIAYQVVLGISDAARNIDEIMIRYRILLASNIPQRLVKLAITAFMNAIYVYTDHEPQSEYLEILIDRLREANRRLDSHDPELAMQLALLLCRRFRKMSSIDDYKEAITLFDQIITSEPNRDCPGPVTANALYFSAILAADRVNIYKNPDCLEEAICFHRNFLRITSTDNFRRSLITEGMAILVRKSSSNFGITREDPPETPSPDQEIISFPHLIAALSSRSTIDKSHWWAVGEERRKYLRPLETVCYTTDIAEIAEAIEYCQLLLALIPPSDAITYFPAKALGEVLFHAFECTGNMEYLNKSITAFRNMLGMPITKWAHFQVIVSLHNALSIRCNHSGDEEDLDKIMQLCSMASKDMYTKVPDRLELSYDWAENARRKGHHSTSTAYETALSLVEDTLTFAPTLETQHFHLVSRRDIYEALPENIASYEVSKGGLQHAIQALERGRALIWSEMRGFRTSINQLAFASHLADEFATVNRELEALTTSISPDLVMNHDNGREHGEGMDPFGRLVVRHRELSAKRKELVSQIQEVPGLEGFFKKPSFDTLRSAAVCGPVLIVNHSKWRCDILIVHLHTHPSLITTPDYFYDRAIELRNRLVHTRNNNTLESRQYQRALRSVLESLYELVGQPVIKELRRLRIPEQSRIWWCPTSVFCSLPLHAMGPIPSDDGILRYFSDLYIPSYTPTLSALIESRNPRKSSLERPSVLLVANPDKDMQDAVPEIWHVQRLGAKVTTLMGKRATPSTVVEGLQNHRFAHFVCHGILEAEKPFNASFELSNGLHLMLLEIVRSRLPDAEFAFLSACHTAELTEGSIADEGLHLAAAVQYCGFRSVVGTMWAMADQDGGDLAKHFYDSMFSTDEADVPYHERSARALRDAVRAIRKEKRLPLEQWVNFVHYGA